MRDWCLAVAVSSFPVEDAFAQSSTNVATVAVDAFGEKVGSEQIGLYNEQQVRGFSLQDSGNYRMDGAYFIRGANITDTVLDGVTIRVGINALGEDFPAPSGVVEYRLSTAQPGVREQVEMGLRDYGGWAVLLRGSAGTANGKIGTSYGINYINDYGSDGAKRAPRHFGLLPLWRPSDKLEVRGMFSADRITRPGDYGVTLSGTDLPSPQPHPNIYQASWSGVAQWQIAAGSLVKYTVTDHLAVQGAFVLTDWDRKRNDFTQLVVGADGKGTASAVLSRPYHNQALSGETRMSWLLTGKQRLFATVRWRNSGSESRPGVAVPIGAFDQERGVAATADPGEPTDVTPTKDRTRQVIGGLGYEADLTDKLWFRAAVLRTRYEKEVTPPGLPSQTNITSPWLYNLATTYAPLPNLTIFATTVKGLEESGFAPNNAANRNEVLPAVRATQYELGLRYKLAANVTFIGSLFEVSKPTPGLDTLNVYRLIGQARHRGVELSLTGRPMQGVNVVGGVALLDADRRGELIDRGVLLGKAAGVPAMTGLLNLTYQLPFVAGLSIDSQLNYTSKRLLNPRTGVYTPAYATLDIGMRYAFEIGESPAVIRARLGNAFDQNAWSANRNETLGRVQRRAFRLSLTTNFTHGMP